MGLAYRSGRRPRLIAEPEAPVLRRLDEQLAQEGISCLGVLAASITEEISTPLTCVTVHLQTLAAELCRAAGRAVSRDKRPLRPDELAERALLGVAGTQRLRDVVRHVSAFSHFNDKARLTDVNVATALDMAVEMGTSEHMLRMPVVTLCDDVPDVKANPEQLAHALLSLLIAAAQSCEEADQQGHELRVMIRQEAADVVVEVGDSHRGPHTRRSDEILDRFRANAGKGTARGWGCHSVPP